MQAWDLVINRDDLAKTELIESPKPKLAEGEVRLRVDRVGMTANNVTYALVGDSMRYWQFFPSTGNQGRVPLWGFADVEESASDDVLPGTRVYGYLPPSSHLVVQPQNVTEHGFKDASPHRAGLPSAYNVYSTTTGDPSYDPDREDLQILYRPLFITSFMLNDFFSDNGYFGSEQLLMSSASSKTAYGTAFCARRDAASPRLIGLTSKANLDFTKSLGCYDDVIAYEDVEGMSDGPRTLYADMAGNLEVRRRMHGHFGDNLVYDAVVGATHLSGPPAEDAGAVPGVRPIFFFAPDQIAKRRQDWGPRGVEARFGEAWQDFVPKVETWVDVRVGKGPEALESAWLEVLSGKSDPRTGHIIQF